MNEPQWVTELAVATIHTLQLDEHGGQDGVRDPGMLDSALNRPRNLWAYTKADLPAIGAAYAFGIAKNHPFLDGNKRTAGVVCETFLLRNRVAIEATNDAWYEAVLALAASEMSEEAFAEWLRQHTKSLD